MMNIIKRDGRVVPYDATKIYSAINKANNEVEFDKRMPQAEIILLIRTFEEQFQTTNLGVEQIQDYIEDWMMNHGHCDLARVYIRYRYKRALVRKSNTTDESILSLIRGHNKELEEENSNKNTTVASTQRDYIAGEVSRDVSTRMLLPEKVVDAHNNGVIHFHDMDYFIQPIFNCCLINIGDMLDNGTCINGKMIESPKSFRTACTIMTQIIASVASNQYGGQSVDIRHLGKYLRKSRDKFKKIADDIPRLSEADRFRVVKTLLKEELSAGVQTIQYQINTLMTTNG